MLFVSNVNTVGSLVEILILCKINRNYTVAQNDTTYRPNFPKPFLAKQIISNGKTHIKNDVVGILTTHFFF